MRSALLFALLALSLTAYADDSMPVMSSDAETLGVTVMPYGWDDLCHREPKECKVHDLKPKVVTWSRRLFAIVDRVNRRVNKQIEPVSNLEHWGTLLDHWDYPKDGKGDCKTYALWKRKLLMDLHIPRQALLMTIVRDLNNEGHTILTLRTDRGDFILDNMVEEIRPWDETGYKFVKRQSETNPNVWLTIKPVPRRPPTSINQILSEPVDAAPAQEGGGAAK